MKNSELFSLGMDILRKRVFFLTFIDLCIHGKEKKDLELVRIGLNNRLNKRLRKKYLPYINQDKEQTNQNIKKMEDTIWIAWFQGIENAPIIVRKCYESVQFYLHDKNIILITEENYKEYVDLPDFIITKRKNGIISDAHFSDILRIELLYRYGGTWIDATVLLTSNNFPEAYFHSEIFFFQKLKPGSNGDRIALSSWFIHAIPNHEIIRNTRTLLFEYWKKENYLIDYFLLHHFLSISRDIYEMKKKVPKFSNDAPHILLLEINQKFDSNRLNDILKITSIHKLSYKKIPIDSKGTFYEYIINNN
ncbi:capsular polysaccharide synthesis protein [Enterococcus gallinarum]|uniref:capsular polysaccharide synthesis protein n=1 Tax=Enterococcus gallinarum TaxID=1353 RepID=UPI00189C3228|nr:capsular polysaccharide synthesis protein [Enterococcus gallinarum]MEB5880305.1 capsular polysaccharide synthesis protein [Enterococcus gallinarum]